jgi:hypothetical protein
MSGLIQKVGNVIEGVDELCEQHLVYLQDDGFKYFIDINEDLNSDLYNQGDNIWTIMPRVNIYLYNLRVKLYLEFYFD